MTLAEMMVAIVVLGVILSGLAAVIINIARTSVISEREVRATSYAQQIVEELNAVDWHKVALYEDHVDDVESDHGSAGELWLGRLDGDGRYDGEELVLLDAPESEDHRLGDVPEPVSVHTGSDSVEYTAYRYITETDRTGDGANDSLKFTVYVTWDGAGRDRQVSITSERGPKAVEDPDDVRVTQFHTSPVDTVTLDGWNLSNGIDVTVHTSGSVLPFTAELRYPVVVEDPAASGDDPFEERYMWSIETISMDHRPGSNYTIFDGTIPADGTWYTNGSFRMRFEAHTDDMQDVSGTSSLAFIDGEYDAVYPDPVADDLPFPGPEGWDPDDPEDPDNGDDGDPIDQNLEFHPSWLSGWSNHGHTICVDGDWIADGFEMEVRVRGLTEDNGTVRVVYTHAADSHPPGNPPTATVSDSLSYAHGGATDSTWVAEITAGQERRWRDDSRVTFTVEAERDGDDQSLSEEFEARADSSC